MLPATYTYTMHTCIYSDDYVRSLVHEVNTYQINIALLPESTTAWHPQTDLEILRDPSNTSILT
jgi:hypothetical protein